MMDSQVISDGSFYEKVADPLPRAMMSVEDPFTPVVAVEGLDGAGKNTFTNSLVDNLRSRGLSVGAMSFPRYGTRYADIAADALHGGQAGASDSAHAMALLFAMDRAEAAETLADMTLVNDVVILDRYVASNAAYTAARLGEDRRSDAITWIEELEFERMGSLVPTLQVFLDTPREVAASRASSREASDSNRARDSYERDDALQVATGEAYRHLAELNWMSPWLVYGLDPDIDALAEIIFSEIDSEVL